ncbi:MAG TPA: DNA internalization-related competence protein ComEC/Rec2 [Virgibacillus sp.]|nr:DNA internalization-related competence protein ComEC/Rec2 [Virgibacillus sp.]
MKGYWHVVALSAGMSALSTILMNNWFMIGFLLWLFYLFYTGRLEKIPLITAMAFLVFFTFYIPSKVGVPHPENIQKQPAKDITLEGQLVSPVKMDDHKVEFILQLDDSNQQIMILHFPDRSHSLEPIDKEHSVKHGAICQVTGELQIPDEGRNPGQFDYRGYLQGQGITYQLVIESMSHIECSGSSLLNIVFDIRNDLINFSSENRSQETAAWLNALVLGDDSLLDEEIIELFQRWSLSHLLAISGLHIGIIISVLYFMLIKLNMVTRERAQWIMAVFLPLYALLAGGQPSVWRASLMALFIIILTKLRIKMSISDGLSLIFIVLMVMDKYIVYQIGFQLSFIVTFGLILSRAILKKPTSFFFQVLQISFISQMMILPLQMNYFANFQPLSILLNILVVPYFSLIVIPLMFFLLLLSFIPLGIVHVVDLLFTYMQSAFIQLLLQVDKFASFPLKIGDMPVLMTVIYYALFIMLMINLQSERNNRAFTYGLLLVSLLVFLGIRPYLSPIGTITMLDIGQGDAFVVELPYRKGVMFIDAGSTVNFDHIEPNKRVYKQVIKPYLDSRGITEIDAILLSHEHIDHVGSVSFMLEDMRVEEIIISKYYEINEQTESFWKSYGTDIRKVDMDDHITIAGQFFHVLAPSHDVSANENSLVLYTSFGGKQWLFTGDIGKSTEKKMISDYKNLTVDVLKVAHHGSNTSTDLDFIQQTNPTYALISAGVNNRYGHPDPEVLTTLEEEKVIIFRTDEHGAVQFEYKNKEGTFSPFLP